MDTSAWAEWLADTPTGAAVAAEIPPAEDWVAPTTVLLELAKWVARELSEESADQAMAFALNLRNAPLDRDLAMAAARLCGRHRLSTADAVIYATAQSEGADLLTCDAHFRGLPGVVYIAKVAPH